MVRLLTILALVGLVVFLAPTSAADPYICFLNVDAHCAIGYNTPPQSTTCSGLAPGQNAEKQFFVHEGAASLDVGHSCSVDSNGTRTDQTYADAAHTHLVWGAQDATSCDIIVFNDVANAQAETPCPAGARIPDLLP